MPVILQLEGCLIQLSRKMTSTCQLKKVTFLFKNHYFFNSFISFMEESTRSARGSRAQSLEDVKNVDKGTVTRSGRKYSDNLYRQCLGMSNFVCFIQRYVIKSPP